MNSYFFWKDPLIKAKAESSEHPYSIIGTYKLNIVVNEKGIISRENAFESMQEAPELDFTRDPRINRLCWWEYCALSGYHDTN